MRSGRGPRSGLFATLPTVVSDPVLIRAERGIRTPARARSCFKPFPAMQAISNARIAAKGFSKLYPKCVDQGRWRKPELRLAHDGIKGESYVNSAPPESIIAEA